MRIAIIDYGAGNLFSLKNALDYIGQPCTITRDKGDLEKADALILPGVGAFPDAMKKLTQSGLVEEIRHQAQKKPLLGICLGMQLLFETGYEFTKCEGLGLIEGSVVKMEECGLKIPHMGWNELEEQQPSVLMQGVEDKYVYFVHSYKAQTADENIYEYAWYGQKVPALVGKGFVFGAQFHPEKSGESGLLMLKNFGGLV